MKRTLLWATIATALVWGPYGWADGGRGGPDPATSLENVGNDSITKTYNDNDAYTKTYTDTDTKTYTASDIGNDNSTDDNSKTYTSTDTKTYTDTDTRTFSASDIGNDKSADDNSKTYTETKTYTSSDDDTKTYTKTETKTLDNVGNDSSTNSNDESVKTEVAVEIEDSLNDNDLSEDDVEAEDGSAAANDGSKAATLSGLGVIVDFGSEVAAGVLNASVADSEVELEDSYTGNNRIAGGSFTEVKGITQVAQQSGINSLVQQNVSVKATIPGQ